MAAGAGREWNWSGKREWPRGSEMFQPMLATVRKEFPADDEWGDEWVFEPKYDVIRIVALVTTGAVAMMTRNGIDKSRQFPEISEALRELGKKLDRNVVIDGEAVALDARGEPERFQMLQNRMHLEDAGTVASRMASSPTALIAFDIIADGESLIGETWDERRAHLERVLKSAPRSLQRVLRASDVAYGSPAAMLREASQHGWEGIMAKRRECRYEPGRRVKHWQKLKLENEQEFVVGGFTAPRNSRKHFGALLLGHYDKGKLIYAGHTGTGFSDAMLGDIAKKLKPLVQKESPYAVTPKTNEQATWVAPKYVAQVRFNEWTEGGNLRHPVFVGLREDKKARDVVREPVTARSTPNFETSSKASMQASSKASMTAKKPKTSKAGKHASVIAQLRANPNAKSLELQLDGKTSLDVTNLGKVFFPKAKVTKGRLLEYYAEVSPYLLPALEDRPLVLKRHPNGIDSEAFYQQKAPDKVPPGVRVEEIPGEEVAPRRLVGGNLATLLYIVQLGAISTDPWHSRDGSVDYADYSIVDLDPGPSAPFKRVVQVARWVKEELDDLGLHGIAKTSGASGIHIVLPLPKHASYRVSVALAQFVATRVNQKHPKETTLQRAVKARAPGAVYVDYLQNIRGKTVASVYSARAEAHASVSTPLKWTELQADLHPSDFTVDNLPKRLKRVGDLWAAAMRRPNRLPGIVGESGGDAAA